MKRTWRRVVAASLVGGAVVGALWLLPALPFFRIRQVEVEGVRHLGPEQVVRGLGLSPRHSLLARLGPIERRVEGMAGVVDARVSRRLPATLRVQVVEETPVAFAPGPDGLVALDAQGRPLPYDPAVTAVDLPLMQRADRAVLAVLARAQMTDSSLYGDIESARRGPRQTVILELGEQRVTVRADATAEELEALGAVRRHLADAGRAYRELDARFAGWVVVRRNRS